MITERDFINDMLAKPMDTGPQLVFADWLEEQGKTKQATTLRELADRGITIDSMFQSGRDLTEAFRKVCGVFAYGMLSLTQLGEAWVRIVSENPSVVRRRRRHRRRGN